MTIHHQERIKTEVIYDSVRGEILDQKKCQFQILTAALTLSTAALAYGISHESATQVVYAAPMIMNVMTLRIILDKATSIQRMVGYLQLMESRRAPLSGWMWEYHLNIFRGSDGIPAKADRVRKHSYIQDVAVILMTMNFIFLALNLRDPIKNALKSPQHLRELLHQIVPVDYVLIALFLVGITLAVWGITALASGIMTSDAIRERWQRVFSEADDKLLKEQVEASN